MKIIKDLTVTITYQVGLGNIKTPDIVYKQLIEASDNDIEINPCSTEYLEAADWLSNNIREKDCMFWEAKIDNIE